MKVVYQMKGLCQNDAVERVIRQVWGITQVSDESCIWNAIINMQNLALLNFTFSKFQRVGIVTNLENPSFYIA